MLNGDTIKLLRECDAGTKMAVYSMDEICDKISDTDFKNVVRNMNVLVMKSIHN